MAVEASGGDPDRPARGPSPGSRTRLLADLAAILGPGHVLTDPGERAGFETDWTGRFGGPSLAVVRPGSTDEVAAVLAACHAAGQPVVPQGGNTGLVGGGVPRGGEIVISLRRLAGVGEVDPLASEVVAGAGTTLAAVQHAASEAGLAFGLDLASRDGATVGGLIATNAGGIRVLAYGSMRDQVLGLEAVLADGSIVRRLDGPRKDNTGYDLAGLIAGSEGTLAIVTAARLRLVPRPGPSATAFVGVAGVQEGLAVLARLRGAGMTLTAAEVVWPAGLDLVLRHEALDPPLAAEYPLYLLVEAIGVDPLGTLAATLDGAPEALDAVAVDDPRGRSRLWRYREAITEAVSREGVPHKLDVCLPLHRLAGFVDELDAVVRRSSPGSRLIVWGHLAEGNLHVNVLGPAPDDDAVDEAVLELTIAHSGAISGEHGIGVAKTRWLESDRGATSVAAMRAIKRALDPGGILNPGVLFEWNGASGVL